MADTVTTINPYTEHPIKEYRLLDEKAAQQYSTGTELC